ncbi:hypothetical protein Fmac_029411 [Flemingia macrophylla]|uniref:Uncharacterized protein n=1 Tax=Flemingia macrophylla TaxID=520843 RepID=A0ABD1LA91_9FABA
MAEATRHHEHGFSHAIRQAKRFCDLKGHEFDIAMSFYQGKYMSYDDMPEEASPDEDVESLPAEGGEDKAETKIDDTQAQEDEAEREQFIDVVGDEAGPSGQDRGTYENTPTLKSVKGSGRESLGLDYLLFSDIHAI